MPPSFSMTSPVAAAAARILAAYLSNHKLTPAEAATLSGTIAGVLASLAAGAAASGRAPAVLAAEPARRGRPKVRVSRRPPAGPADEPVAPEQVSEPAPPSPEPEPEPVADAEPEFEPEVALAPQAEVEPEVALAPQTENEPEVEVEAEAADELPRKRKRPSRPRSRRGKGLAVTPASETMPGVQAEAIIVAPESEPAPEAVPEAILEPIIAEAPPETPLADPKPRRATSRTRRVPVP